jgi:acetylornithine deacetylase/succinyl-diaminopimelate desuccinylase-like protein
MKAGLSCILEIVRLLAARPRRFDGELLVTVYGLHEAPLGHAEGLTRLIEQGVVGDAALVMEGPPEGAVVCGKGQSIWTLTLEREGAACHELRRPGSADDLLDAALMAARALRAENGRLAGIRHELLGAESLFIGQIHFGDFYNRSPAACTLQGTRRWHPDRRFEEVQTQLERLLDSAGLAGGIRKRIEWTFVGESYAVDPQEPIVRAFREAARELRGAEPALAGVSSVLDTSRLVPLGRVPAVPIDCDGATGHADSEFVRMPSVRDACALALATVLRYLSDPAERRP